jgi:hypothetical protein
MFSKETELMMCYGRSIYIANDTRSTMRESLRNPGGGVLSGSTPNVPLYSQSISSGVGLSHVQGNEFHEIEMVLIGSAGYYNRKQPLGVPFKLLFAR